MIKKGEIIVISILLMVLGLVNVIGFLRGKELKERMSLIIEEGTKAIDINNARPDEFEMLPGIGPALAQRIIEDGVQHGGFKNLDELKTVKGIGEKKFQKILPFIKL
jgi:competence ComEA-like helix-hairpin-helix protein